MRSIVILISFFVIVSCASNNPFLAVNHYSVTGQEGLKVDTEQCLQVAKDYDLSDKSEGKAVAGVAIGTASAAGVATTVAGAALAPAIPLILAGGGLWSANIAREAKDKIFNECMKDRGYEVYIAN